MAKSDSMALCMANEMLKNRMNTGLFDVCARSSGG
jgi:hypothetical protein